MFFKLRMLFHQSLQLNLKHEVKTFLFFSILFFSFRLFFIYLFIFNCGVPTWVIEWHQYVGGRLLLSSSLAVDDIEGDSLGLRNVVGHAAGGVDDKTQHGRASDTH